MPIVQFEDALNETLVDKDPPLPVNLRDAADVYTKAEVNALIPSLSNVYTKTETNSLLNGKVTSVQAGTNISINSADPLNPIISASGGGGSGDVVGPASATDGNIAVYDGATGKLIKEISYSTFRTNASLVVGTDVQAYNAALAPLAGVSTNGSLHRTAANTYASRTLTGTANQVDVTNGNGVSANPTVGLATVAIPYGKQAVPIPAGAMKAQSTNGAAAGTVEMTTNKNMFVTLDFDPSTQEYAQFSIAMPKSWNESTVTFVPVWSHAATTTNFGVVFSLAGVAVSNDDAGDVAFGTAQTSTDTGGTTNDIYFGPESSAITIAGSPAATDLVMFQVARVPADAGDTMAIDARLHGIVLFITTDAGNDA